MVLRITQMRDVSRALEYYESSLSVGDYQGATAVSVPRWGGEIAASLGLEGQAVTRDDFAAILFNIDPRSLHRDSFETRLKRYKKALRSHHRRRRQWRLKLEDCGRRGEAEHLPEYKTAKQQRAINKWRAQVVQAQSEGLSRPAVPCFPDDTPQIQLEEGEERLTPRVRPIPGHDLTFSTPKGVSLLWAAGDRRLEEAFQEAIKETVHEVQKLAMVRVRVGPDGERVNYNAATGKILTAGFTHDTSRPIEQADGSVTVDPHLHCHLAVLNLTQIDEGAFRSLKATAIYEQAALAQEIFEARLARLVEAAGYEVGRRGKFWDVTCVSPDAAETYSLRRREVDQLAQKFGITNPRTKSRLGATSRNSKDIKENVDLPEHIRERTPELADHLEAQIALAQKVAERGRGLGLSEAKRAELADEAVAWALQKNFERREDSYVHRWKADALRYASYGCYPEDVEAAIARRGHLSSVFDPDTMRTRTTTSAGLKGQG